MLCQKVSWSSVSWSFSSSSSRLTASGCSVANLASWEERRRFKISYWHWGVRGRSYEVAESEDLWSGAPRTAYHNIQCGTVITRSVFSVIFTIYTTEQINTLWLCKDTWHWSTMTQLIHRSLIGIKPSPEPIQAVLVDHQNNNLSSSRWVNSLWFSNAIWLHRSGSTLAQVMACCLSTPCHYWPEPRLTYHQVCSVAFTRCAHSTEFVTWV